MPDGTHSRTLNMLAALALARLPAAGWIEPGPRMCALAAQAMGGGQLTALDWELRVSAPGCGKRGLGAAATSERRTTRRSDVLAQLSRAATPHTITGPALPNGAPLGPVMYPSLASFRIRNSSVSRPRYPFSMDSSVHS
jgi:hypothetical protein